MDSVLQFRDHSVYSHAMSVGVYSANALLVHLPRFSFLFWFLLPLSLNILRVGLATSIGLTCFT